MSAPVKVSYCFKNSSESLGNKRYSITSLSEKSVCLLGRKDAVIVKLQDANCLRRINKNGYQAILSPRGNLVLLGYTEKFEVFNLKKKKVMFFNFI